MQLPVSVMGIYSIVKGDHISEVPMEIIPFCVFIPL